MFKKNKFIKILSVVAILIIVFSGCTTNNNETNSTEPEQNSKNDRVESEGKYTTISEKKLVNISQKQGPVNYIINNITVSEFTPEEHYKNMYHGKDKLITVEMDVELENTEDKKIDIVPLTSKLLLNDKTQIELNVLNSDATVSSIQGNSKVPCRLAFYIPVEEVPNHFKLFCKGAALFSDGGVQEYPNFDIDINL